MKRIRWFNIDWAIPLRQLAKKLNGKKFSQDGLNGFFVDRVRDDSIEARYFERNEYTENIIDPFGKEIYLPRIEIKKYEFIATNNFPGFELIDSPRSSQGLISKLLEASGFTISISQLDIDVVRWVEQLETKEDVELIVTQLHISALDLGGGAIANIAIRGNNNDIFEKSKRITRNSNYKIDKIQAKMNGKYSGNILLTSSGAVKIDANENLNEIQTALRKSLIYLK